MIFRGKLCDSLILLPDPPSLQYLSLPSISSPPFYISPSLRFLSSLPSTLLPFRSLPSLPFLSLPPEPFSSIPFPSLLYHLLFFHFTIPPLSLPLSFATIPFSAFPHTFYFSAFSLPSISLLSQTTFPPPLFHKLKRNNIFYFLIMIFIKKRVVIQFAVL